MITNHENSLTQNIEHSQIHHNSFLFNRCYLTSLHRSSKYLQPFCVCISLLFFIKALDTNHWKFWILTSLANVIGFYIYIFMIFLFVAELIIVLFHFRSRLSGLIRPLVSQIPFLVGVFLWIVPILSRYGQVQEEFWTKSFTFLDLLRIGFYFGTGTDFRDQFVICGILNLPFFIGFAALNILLNTYE